MRTKHVPLRSCISCGAKASKRDLIRIVCTAEGVCLVDALGKQNGRGAYLCHDPACWGRALKTGRLASALRTEMPAADRQTLAAFGESLPAAGHAMNSDATA